MIKPIDIRQAKNKPPTDPEYPPFSSPQSLLYLLRKFSREFLLKILLKWARVQMKSGECRPGFIETLMITLLRNNYQLIKVKRIRWPLPLVTPV